MDERQRSTPHPLDGCDENECYKTMMSERTVLVAAQRDAEDNLVKTVIQLSSALVVLMAGFTTQRDLLFTGIRFGLFFVSLACLVAAILCGISENFFSSRAYREQQKLLEDYYSKRISSFTEPKSNAIVRTTQALAFLFFITALLCVAIFAVLEAKGKSNVKQSAATAATGAAAAATGAATAAAATAAAAAAAAAAATDQFGAGQSAQQRYKVSSPDNAAATSQKEKLEQTR